MLAGGLALVALVLCSFAALAEADVIEGNLLANPSFESGDTTGWQIGGNSPYGVDLDDTPIEGEGAAWPTVVNVRSGDYAFWAKLKLAPPWHIELSQTVDLEAGVTYEIGLFLGIGVPENSNSAYRNIDIYVNDTMIYREGRIGQEWVDWLDGLGPENFECHSVEYTAEVDQTVVIRFDAIGSGSAWVGFSFDDFFAIPEPSSIATLSLGVILAVRRQR